MHCVVQKPFHGNGIDYKSLSRIYDIIFGTIIFIVCLYVIYDVFSRCDFHNKKSEGRDP